MDISPRTPIITTEPAREGNGTCRRWSRTINGRPYSFNAVTMPNGERRYFVSRYNGYLSDADGLPTPGATKWGCAWSPAHEWIVPVIAPESLMIARTDPSAAVVALDGIDVSDPERAHSEADELLRAWAPREIREAYDRVAERCRWWAGA